jgi:type IX secretion system PorP/SprF family membrane protein
MIRLLLPIVFLFFTLGSIAQDNAFSQFFANRIYLNPAFAGIEKGLQATVGMRSQWLRADGGYQFGAVAVEWQEDCWRSGFGLTLQYADEGIAPLRTTGAGFTYAYVLPYRNGNVHFGLQYAYNQKTLDWSRLTFSDQLDPVFGSIFGTSAAVGLDRVDFHDFSAGILWRSDSRLIGRKKSLVRYRSHLGLSVNHLWSLLGQGPDESFLQSGTEIPARITLHGGVIIPLVFLTGSTHKIVVSPNFRLETQGFSPLNLRRSVTLFSGGAYFIVEQAVFGAYYHSRSPLPGIRNTNAVALSLGFTQSEKQSKKQGYYLGASVDVNLSGLGIRSGNVYELNFRYNFRDVRPFCEKRHAATTRKTVMECKDFY